MSNPMASLPPGFRFHPTDQELILHYLRSRAVSLPCPAPIIADVDLYKLDPWHLPAKAVYGEREWYFFSPRDRKYPNGQRPNRAAASGYWKATGTDKPIVAGQGKESIGVKKALVFYKGKPPKGTKTDWIMHEYRLAGPWNSHKKNNIPTRQHNSSSMRLDDWVLCRIYKKSNHMQSAAAAAADQEQEDSCVVDGDASPLMTPALPKSISLSDLLLDSLDCSALSQLLLESAQDIPSLQLEQLIRAEPSVPVARSGVKRQRLADSEFSLPTQHLA